MFNRKFKIIILAVIIFFSSVALVFWLKSRSENPGDKKIVDNITVESGRQPAENEIIAKNFKELRANHPEFSAAQLEFYKGLAVKGSMAPCEGRDDANDCVSAVAFITERYYICGDIEETQTRIKCADSILSKIALPEVKKCVAVNNNDFKTECLVNIFRSYQRPEDCLSLKAEEARKICEGVVYYQKALMQGNKKLCDKIKDEYLKSYCVK